VPLSDVILQATDLGKQFSVKGKLPVAALTDVSLIVHQGEITGLVGPDGAGKTTLLRIAAGLLVPSRGTASVLGLDSVAASIEIQSRVGYMPQQFGLYQELTVAENLNLYADLQAVPIAVRRERFDGLLRMTGLGDFTRRRAGDLSGGMKQKLGLACSLIKKPQLLLLDEPTVGVDPVSRRDLWQIVYHLVEEEEIGVLMATSYLDEADRCHRLLVLHEGRKIAEGEPAEFRERIRGKVFMLRPLPEEGPRPLQSKLAGRPGIVDVSIRSGRVRCVLEKETFRNDPLLFPPGLCQSIEPSNPTFEDAFMTMVSGDVDLHREEVSAPAPPGRPGNGSQVVVQVRDLTKAFGNFIAVKGISFEVRGGEIFGLLGPNGAGKSTTFRMLCGLLRVSGGEIHVAGQDLRRAGAKSRSHLGYMAQVFSLYGLYGQRLRQRIDWALDEFHLRGREDSLAGNLPGGFRQRLAMAAALLHEPAILFLDEPTSGADPLARREFWLRISGFAQKGVTVIVTTHFMEEAEYCDRLLIMSRGKELAHGTPADIRRLAVSKNTPEPTVEDAFIALAEDRIRSDARPGAPQ
jgi:ABC-2 type transport system ATP-binding protein